MRAAGLVSFWICALAALFGFGTAEGQLPELSIDIAQGLTPGPSTTPEIANLAAIPGGVAVSVELRNRPDVWVSDGSPAGTRLVLPGCRDGVFCGPAGAIAQLDRGVLLYDGLSTYSFRGVGQEPVWLWAGAVRGARVGGRFIGVLYSEEPVRLVRTDGTLEGTSFASLDGQAGVGQVLPFDAGRALVTSEASGFQAFLTDGTEVGTQRLETPYCFFCEVFVRDGEIILSAQSSGDLEIWRIDPGGGPADLLGVFPSEGCCQVVATGDLIVVHYGDQSSVYDGVSFSPIRGRGRTSGSIGDLLVQDRLPSNGDHRVAVHDLTSGEDLSLPSEFLDAGGSRVYDLPGRALIYLGIGSIWSLTADGRLQLLSDGWLGAGRVVNGTAFFLRRNELLRTDGTPQGTMLIDLTGDPAVQVRRYELTQQGIFFTTDGPQLWLRRPDGATTRVPTVPVGGGRADLRGLTVFGEDSVAVTGFSTSMVHVGGGGFTGSSPVG